MKIRHKLMILLLAIAIVPAVVASVLHRRSMLKTGDELAGQTRQMLIQNATHHLRTVVTDFGRLVTQYKTVIELALARQAREVEARLAAKPPGQPRLFFSQDYDTGTHVPTDLQTNENYRKVVGGKEQPIPISFGEQVFFVVKGIPAKRVADDMACLSTMPTVYRELYKTNPSLITWLYTSLETGLHSSYPGHGGYPDEYDPRKREWYTAANESRSLIWTLLPEVSTRWLAFTASVSVKRFDGSLAGVTAIDVNLAKALDTIALPVAWRPSATVMLVEAAPLTRGIADKLPIVSLEGGTGHHEEWQRPVDLQFVTSSDPERWEAMIIDMAAGRSGVRRMKYRGTDALWAYGSHREGNPLILVIVPYEVVVAGATGQGQLIRDTTFDSLKVAGLVIAGILLAAIVVAIASARSVTRPLYRLAEAARELSEGNFEAHANIRTGDEVQELADVFNQMGPQLEERQRMKQALTLAKQIQENLLPQESPSIEGFDIAGLSIPCDEIGGDYYDFIDLVELGKGQIGIALGDVTGHGIGAALLMASARSALRNQVDEHGSALDTLFNRLNNYLVRDTGGSRFITLFYGLLDGPTRRLRWISGGQDPALWLCRQTDKFRELTEGGSVPLGLFEEAKYEQAGPVTLEHGDIVLIGTDGIWEARNPEEEQFGKDRLKALLTERADAGAREICDAVVEAVTTFRGIQPQQDDITLVVIKSL